MATLILDDSFTHANTSAGGAGTTTGVPTTPATGAANGWTDVVGSIYSIASNKLSAAYGTNYAAALLLRPTAETVKNTRIIAKYNYQGYGSWPVPMARGGSVGCYQDSTQLHIFNSSGADIGVIASTPLSSGSAMYLVLDVVSSDSTHTDITATLYAGTNFLDVPTGTILVSSGGSAATPISTKTVSGNTSISQATGRPGVSRGGSTVTDRVLIYDLSASASLTAGTVSAGSVTASGATYSGTAATNGTATFTYQYQRCTDNGSNAPTGTLGNDTGWTAVGAAQSGVAAGVAPSSQADTGLSASTKYWCRYKVTDSAGTPAIAYATAVSFTTLAPAATLYTATPSPNPVTAGSACTITLTPDGTSSVTVTATPSGSASTGLSAQTATFDGTATAKTVAFTPTVSGTLTVTYTNSGSLSNASNSTITVNSVPLAIARPTCTPHKTSLDLVAVATGGSGSKSYQWSHSTSFQGPYSAIPGATTASYTHAGLTFRTRHFYKCTVTDTSGSATSLILSAATVPAHSIGLGFMGDSITNNLSTGTVAALATYVGDSITSGLYADATIPTDNQGAGGTQTSHWRTDAAPYGPYGVIDQGGATQTAVLFTYATGKWATTLAGKTDKYISIMLGSNDASNGVGVATYRANLLNITAGLTALGFRSILHYPICQGPHATDDNGPAIDLLYAYQAAIDSLVDNVNVFQGDQDGYLVFCQHSEDAAYLTPAESGGDGLHPTTAGRTPQVKMWADAIVRVIEREGRTTPALVHPVRFRRGNPYGA